MTSTEIRRMDPEVKAQWLAALRNPETPQTTGTLNRLTPETRYREDSNETYTVPAGLCCLGVLTEIAVGLDLDLVERVTPVTGCVEYRYTKEDDEDASGSRTEYETGVLPSPVAAWAGLPDENPWIMDEDGRKTTVATLNDRGHTFAQIADLIEAQF